MLSLAVLAVAAQPASAAFREVAPGGSDAGNNCAGFGEPCATIQHAIDEAESGDTVDVRAGTYKEDLVIDKPLQLRGPGVAFRRDEPEAVIEGAGATTIKIESNGIAIEGMTVLSPGPGIAIRAMGPDADSLVIEQDVISGGSVGVQLEAGGEKDQIGFNVIEAVGDGIELNGSAYSELEVRWNHFLAPITGYTVLAGTGTTIEELRLEGNEMAAPARLAARITAGMWGESLVDENSFHSAAGPQLTIDGDLMSISDNTFEGNGTAACLQILGDQIGLAPSSRIRVYSKNEFLDCDPYGVEIGPEIEEISIFGNNFGGSYDGIVASDASNWDVTGRVEAPWNRFVGTTHLGIDNLASGTFEAEENWWGCNAGPNSAGCDRVSARVDTLNNVKLMGWIGPRKPETGIVEVPPDSSITLNPGEQAEVSAVLTVDGREPVLDIPTETTPVGFSSSIGTIPRPTSQLQNGWTTEYFTAGSVPGSGFISLSMDNQRTLVPVTIRGAMTGSSSSSPAAQAAPASSIGPRIEAPRLPSFRSVGKRSRLKGDRATVGSITCGDACRVVSSRIQIVIASHHYHGAITPRASVITGSSPLQIKFSGPALRALKEHGSARIRGTITVADAMGRSTTPAISMTVNN